MSRQGQITWIYTARGLQRFELEIFHDDLKKYQLIRGDNQRVVQQKASAKMAEWDDLWARRTDREKRNQDVEGNKRTAEERTFEAGQNLALLEFVLRRALEADPTLDWNSLKNHSDYSIPKPQKRELEKLKRPNIPREPRRDSAEFVPRLSIFDKLRRSRREQKEKEAEAAFIKAHAEWETEKTRLLNVHDEEKHQYETNRQKLDTEYTKAVENWGNDRLEYIKQREEGNAAIDKRAAIYKNGAAEGVLDYCDLVLSRSNYPDYFPKSFELDYHAENKLLLVDYQFPPLSLIPTLKQVRYIQSSDKLVESHISELQLNGLYDSLLYQIALRTVYELFKADIANVLSSIVFNGYVKSIAAATGKEINPCILSLQAGKTEFMQINLGNVEPKACFKQLKGVGSSRLHSMTPIAPILKMDREDKRFVASYPVADGLDEAVNLALIDWEDFEHLVRELFEKEYGGPNNEVKVTRASRDHGVDAVAFDSDPIRGGKVVIQAKRYTNTVGVSAVRDLYGTVMNEGAMKGILVTTSDYGPDSYEFAKGKPLTLLNGSNLLFLLEKHGHRAKIDLQEARRVLAMQNGTEPNRFNW